MKKELTIKKFYSMLLGGIMSSIVVSLVLISDTTIAGILVGDKAVAGINLVAPAYSFAAFLGMIFALGAPILYSKALGSFNKEEADHVFHFGLTATLCSGILLSLLFFIGGELYISSFDVAPEILNNARSYMFWIRIDVIFLPIATFIPGMIFVDGDELMSALSDVISAVANIFLSVFLGRMFGVAGIGMASLAGTMFRLGVCSLHFLKKRNSLNIGFYFSNNLLVSNFRYSVVDASSLLFLSIFCAVMNRYLTVRFGPDMLLLASIFTFVTELAFFLDGVGGAMTPVMSIYVSTGCNAGIRKIWREAKKTAIMIGLVFALLLMLLAPFIPRILGFSDPTISGLAVKGIRMIALGVSFTSLLYLTGSYFVVTDRIPLAVAIEAFYNMLLPVTLSIILGNVFGMVGVFAALALSPVITFFGAQTIVQVKYGKEAWPLMLPKEEDSRSFLFDFEIEPEHIMNIQAEVEEALCSEGIEIGTRMRCTLLFEEVFMEVCDRNQGKSISGECALILFKDKILLIEMDDGIIFNLGDSDQEPGSWREYVLSQIVTQWIDSSNYVKAISFNRNRFEIERQEQELL